MAGGSGDDNPVGINVTAMVDIIFCLCLFFMCSLKFKDLEGRMESWLPQDVGSSTREVRPTPRDEIRVLLSWNQEKNSLERMFGRMPIEAGPIGDRKLERLIVEQFAEYRKTLGVDVPVVVDSGPRVPWQSVVDVMGLCKANNIDKVQFGMGSVLGG